MKRIITILVVIAALSSGVVFAASVNGNYWGFPVVNVNVNGTKLISDVPGIIINNRTLLPVRAVAEAMGSIVQWDQKTMTAKITKPSVNMIFVGDVAEGEEGLTITGAGTYFNTIGTDRWENLYVEIGPMENKTYEYRVIVSDPKGNVVGTSETESQVIGKNGLIAFIPVENMTYNDKGTYRFQFQIKYDGKFETVGETAAVVE